jgi:glycosyltransferase involved in cell wall biosynthesis
MATISHPIARSHASPRRSLVLAAAASPRVGGQGLNLQHMVDGLRGAFDVMLFARATSPEVPTRIVPGSRVGGFVRSVPLLRRWRSLHTGADETHFDRWVASRMPRADVFQGAVGQCARSLLAARRLGAKAVLDVVNMHIDQLSAVANGECRRMGVSPPFSRSTIARMHLEYERADLIRVMSRAAKRSFLERGFDGDRVVVATPPLDGEVFPEARFTEPVFRVAYVGLIEPWKGFQYLLEAFSGFPVRDAELVLWGGAGSRVLTRLLERACRREPRIHVRPTSVRAAGLEEVYGKASVLVLPSLTDGFGYAAGEAMASGLPVIVTPNVGAVDLVEDGVNGYVVPAADAGAIRERLVHLAGSPDLVRRMGAAARATAKRLTLASFRESWANRLEALSA